ncbi:hypothetical protein QE417_002912 [Mucilaginibacter terrae]|uniref:Uncharacterized protein n=1 Tax=Mucilaginibacter terrae TaxID=1955052 RepID=A0ABU3GVZ6_9SPHI|nr:hypothetical protein [Mucilaginibacter terrae]
MESYLTTLTCWLNKNKYVELRSIHIIYKSQASFYYQEPLNLTPDSIFLILYFGLLNKFTNNL